MQPDTLLEHVKQELKNILPSIKVSNDFLSEDRHKKRLIHRRNLQ